MTQITMLIPNLGTDEKEFLRAQRMARQAGRSIRVLDRRNVLIGTFDKRGEFHEVMPPALQANIMDRLMHKLLEPTQSKRHTRGHVATMGLLVRYENQLRQAA